MIHNTSSFGAEGRAGPGSPGGTRPPPRVSTIRLQSTGQFHEWDLGEGQLLFRLRAGAASRMAPALAAGARGGVVAGVLLGTVSLAPVPTVTVEGHAPVPDSPASWEKLVDGLLTLWHKKTRQDETLRAVGYYRQVEGAGGLGPGDDAVFQVTGCPSAALLFGCVEHAGIQATLAYRSVPGGTAVRYAEVTVPLESAEMPQGTEATAAGDCAASGTGRHKPGIPRWMRWAAAIAAPAILISVWALRRFPFRAPPPAAPAKVEAGILGLRVERVSGGLAVSWDRTAREIQQAPGGTLSIVEDGRRRDLVLDQRQLASARVVYWTDAEDLELTLSVSGRDRNSWTDSLRWVKGGGAATHLALTLRPSPAPQSPAPPSRPRTATGREPPGEEPLPEEATRPPDPAAPAATPATAPGATPSLKPARPPATGSASREAGPPATDSGSRAAASPATSPASRTAAPPATGSASREAGPPVTNSGSRAAAPPVRPPEFPSPPVPAVGTADRYLPPGPGIPGAASRPIDLPAAPAAPPGPRAAAATPAPVPAVVTQPVPLFKPRPVWPKELGAWIQRPSEIVVRVQVSAAGKVTAAAPVHYSPGAANLAAIATNTARLWRFTPAKSNGRPIPSTFEIQFVFAPPAAQR